MALLIQKQQATPGFKGVEMTVGPASWRSSGGSTGGSTSSSSTPYRSTPYGSPAIYNYAGGPDPLLYYMMMNNQHMPTYNLHKEQLEQAKDQVYLKNHPELKKNDHKGLAFSIGGLATIASALLTKGIEVIKTEAKTRVNFDPVLIIGSVVVGAVLTLATMAVTSPNIRNKRLVAEVEEKTNKIKQEKEV